jgi:5,10-methylene-tetrahydrofolate dehydrogenase/methenyl tetrahydrofolate cyclohydrolase
MQVIDGKETAAEVQRRVAEGVSRLGDRARPVLTLVQMGEDPA